LARISPLKQLEMTAHNQAHLPLDAGLPVEEPLMLAYTVSEIVRSRGRSRFPIQSWRQLRRLALTLALGLPAIMLAFHFLDPAAPLAYIVAPVLAGGLLPLLMMPPGQFEVASRAAGTEALAGALEHAFAGMGFEKKPDHHGALRYGARKQGWLGWHALGWHNGEVELTLRGHAIDVSGPVAILHALRQHMTGNSARFAT
jgi:hypothetical protein